MKVMIVTQSDNIAVTSVAQALERRGAQVFRFDTDRYPTKACKLSFWQGASGPRSVLECPAFRLEMGELDAIWYETIDVGYRLPPMEADVHAVTLRESTAVVEGLGATLDAFELDPVPACLATAKKLRQHRLATEVGLELPRTLLTNDPAEVRRFFRECPGGLITKMQKRFSRVLSIEDESAMTEQVMTTPVTEADLQALDGLELCPMIFQEEIAKKVELRVTIVGNQVFTAELDSQAVPATQYDWRTDQAGNQWRPSELPGPVARMLLALLTRLGLNYGACDLIRTPDDRYVFLEVNSRGKYVHVENLTGLPISEAIADLLLGRVPRRVQASSPTAS